MVQTAQRINILVIPDPLLVFIAFVAGDVDQDFDTGGFTDGFKYVDRAADVRVEGHFRFVVGEADKGLGGKVEDKFRLIFVESSDQPVKIPNISINMRYFIPESRCFKIVRRTGGVKGITDDVRPQLLKPDRQPRPLETGVASDQRSPFFINVIEQQSFHLIYCTVKNVSLLKLLLRHLSRQRLRSKSNASSCC